VSFKDIKDVAVAAMRHRVILNFEGEAEGITTDMVLEKLLTDTPTTIESELGMAPSPRQHGSAVGVGR
jgi:MoxR-like ATPase